MPDIQTEIFTKVLPKMKLNDLTFDDDVGTQQTVTVETSDKSLSVMQQIWEFIHVNPGLTASEIYKQMDWQTYTGISTRLNQLLKVNKLMRTKKPDESYRWFSIGDSYPIMDKRTSLALAVKARQEKLARKAKAKAKRVAKADATPQVDVRAPTNTWDIDMMLSKMSITQARGMYDALKKIFGA
jgi:predicted transcriptional regulator